MTYKLQYLAIVGSIIICIFTYLYHIQNSEGGSQMDRIRLLSASMKIIKFIIDDTTIEGVTVPIYYPLNSIDNKNELLPAVIYYHGGAFYRGSIDECVRIFQYPSQLIYSSIETHPPITRALWKKNFYAKNLQINPARVAIVGDSAGGNFAAVIAMRFANKTISKNRPRLQVLIYPVVQFFDFHGSLTFIEGIFKLDIANKMLKDISQYLKDNL